jgi:hypothetical protein
MFILRRITSKGLEINTCLGEYYVLVRKIENKEEFDKTVKQWSEEDLENVYGIVTYEDGSKIMPLYKESKYYIMASDGKTFDNISEK